MLKDAMFIFDDGTTDFVGSEKWIATVNNIAAGNPGSVAENMVKSNETFKSIGFRDQLSVTRLEEGVYNACGYANVLRDCGLKVNGHPDTDKVIEWNNEFRRRISIREEAKKNGDTSKIHFEPLSDISGEPSSFGIADNLEQIKNYVKPFIDHPTRIFVISIDVVKHESGGGGFRWHKNGPYIGIHEPQYEHFNDEVGIDEVTFFNVIELLEE